MITCKLNGIHKIVEDDEEEDEESIRMPGMYHYY
jgi:hypothetical protein